MVNNLQVVYSGNMKKKTWPKNPNSRVIPNIPDRILDAPELLDDYCKYILHYSTIAFKQDSVCNLHE